MRVLVLGGTGAIGIQLVRNLSQNGIDTFVTTRSLRKSEKKLKYLHGNAKDLDFLEIILSEHWDAIVDFMVYSTDEFLTRVNLLLNATSQYIFLSSARVYANSTQLLKENSDRLLDVSNDKEYLSTDEYSLAKARQEDILKSSGQTNWTIIRPYITYSNERFQLGVLEKEEWLYRALHGRTIVFATDIASKTTTMTDGFDVSKGIMDLIGNKQAFGNDFHITTNEYYKWEEILALYLEIFEQKTGFRPKVIMQYMSTFFKLHPAKYQIEYDRLYDRRFDNSKISRIINNKSFSSVEQGIKRYLSLFLENPKFKQINWKSEALKDKQTKENTPLIEIIGIKQKITYILYRYFPTKVVDKFKYIVK